ncbi:MAG TPA: LuxR C-terminal-related transcriptional regulator [Gaiellaceae bacterium]|jgi:DNA-binding CsgD family transcriptional regulator|nr:LuxR C-terminal-related transcriptional regulator [Gaiellaceae bacterium]
MAAAAQLDGATALDAHERGYRLARELGDDRRASRLALELAVDCLSFRGPAEASGWLERAAHLLEGLPIGMEHGMLIYLRASFALSGAHDPTTARTLTAEGLTIAREIDYLPGEMLFLALDGLARVASGDVAEGMRHLDEATTAAMAGEVHDARYVEQICCHLIDACKRVRDFDRAREWCRRVEEIATRLGDAEIFTTCRIYYGEVLVWRGAWNEAERALLAASRDLAKAGRDPSDSVVRLAELRRRQRRFEEAEALLDEARGHPLASIVAAALALDRGDAHRAADEAERYLRRVGEDDRLLRVPALELLVRARLALDRTREARQAADELGQIAASVGTGPLRGAALLALGRFEAYARSELAPAMLEDAADLLRESGVRAEAAVARVELAAAFRRLGRDDDARDAEKAANRELADLGVDVPERPEGRRRRDALTRRELDVLRLLAQGRSNKEIATELVLSVRTVESHVASIYAKIGVSGRTARAGATAHALANGLG